VDNASVIQDIIKTLEVANLALSLKQFACFVNKMEPKQYAQVASQLHLLLYQVDIVYVILDIMKVEGLA